MNQKAVVARALSEILKIVGALGIVNIFTLAMMNRANISHEGPDHPGAEAMDHYQIEQQVRSLLDPDLYSLAAGLALVLMFMRFIYGSIILLDGDYTSPESKFTRLSKPDLLSIISLMIIFPILSFYGGVGQIGVFSVFLMVALLLDAVTMHLVDDCGESVYDEERKSWSKINFFTFIIFIVILLSYAALQGNGVVLDFRWISGSLIVVYCTSSLIDLWSNRRFYLGLASSTAAAAAPGPPPAEG